MASIDGDHTVEQEFYEIQHSYPSAAQPYYQQWTGAALAQFGAGAIALIREFEQRDAFLRGPQHGNHYFTTADHGAEFLARLQLVAIPHQTIAFRLVLVRARIEIEPLITLEPLRVCGAWLGNGYCGRAPEHTGDHTLGKRVS